ncbi:ubiquitin-like modifier 1 [Ilyonectria destructans]|nr:ubiquitin-like modifier 1 [Ilyonectria destructans]
MTDSSSSAGAPAHATSPQLSLTVEFSGGLEMLFSHQRSHALTIPAADKDGRASTIAYLIDYLCDHVMDDSRKDLFVLDNHLRPGILVLINDADWELEGEEAYEVQSGDSILFVSTLHGG